jgi:drug/metabolite transporter (DMT)-like permease
VTAPPVVLVLLAALLQGAGNTLVKAGRDRLVVAAFIGGVGAALAAFLLPFVPVPAPASWPFLGLSTLAQTAYYVLIAWTYRTGDLAATYPLVRATGVAAVTVSAVLVGGEGGRGGGTLGLALILAGAVTVALDGGPTRLLRAGWRPTLLSVSAGLAVAAYLMADGLGVRRSGAPSGYLAWLFVVGGLPIVALTTGLRVRTLATTLAENWRTGLLVGACATGSYSLVVLALNGGGMASVAALREVSVLFASLGAWYFLNERLSLPRLGGAGLVAAGAMALYF